MFRGASRLIQLSFKQGGQDVYGLRRMLVDENRRSKGILRPGEQKSVHTDRVVFVPGPAEEIEVVRWIFHRFVEAGLGAKEIARQLNERGLVSNAGLRWTEQKIRYMLQNEKLCISR